MDERDRYLRILLDNFEKLNYDDYMNLCYNMIMTFPQDVLTYDDVSAKHRIESLDKLISHFAEKEEYEKCNEIKKIQSLLNNDNI
jgi:hypothetical protein